MTYLENIAARLEADELALTSSFDLGPFVAQETGPEPTLLVGDQSEISLQQPANSNNLEHRMALLARPGDTVLVHKRDPFFEVYLRSHLGIGNVTFLQVDTPSDLSVSKHAWQSTFLVNQLAQNTRQTDGLTVKSYLTTGNSWLLGRSVGENANRTVYVCGPTP